MEVRSPVTVAGTASDSHRSSLGRAVTLPTPTTARPTLATMPRTRILVLAGTTEARLLAERLHDTGHEVIVSLAGRTSSTRHLAGEIRSGGFGGAPGLARFIADRAVTTVVCATHPFAARMPFNATDACAITGTPLIRLLRPAWHPVDGDRWVTVADLDRAADALITLGSRHVLLTTGRQELRPFAALGDISFTVRCIEPPDVTGFARADVVLDRGPFTVQAERALLAERSIDAVVSKNSGGAATAAKLVAAREARVPVVMVERPMAPAVHTVERNDDVIEWIVRQHA